jgi:hypothetical protein
MNKNMLLLLMVFICHTTVFCQVRMSGNIIPIAKSEAPLNISTFEVGRALGDTLMYFPLPGVILLDTNNQNNFALVSEDVDGLNTNNVGAPIDFALYQSTNAVLNQGGFPTADNFYFPWENPSSGDTAYFLGGTSWFNPPGTSNNWAMFGPVTIPTGSATFKWYDRTNAAYRDGYKVWVANAISGTEPTSTDFENGTSPIGTIIFSRPDAYPSPTASTDTTWIQREVPVFSSSPGAQVWFGFQHKANDMDVLYLDEFLLTEDISASMNESNVKNLIVSQNHPNPFNNQTTISYTLNNRSNINFKITDIMGRLIFTSQNQNQTPGNYNIRLNAADFNAGTYYYTFVCDNMSVTQKMFITK